MIIYFASNLGNSPTPKEQKAKKNASRMKNKQNYGVLHRQY